MKKYILWGIASIILIVAGYYGSFFIFNTEVNEEPPQANNSNTEQNIFIPKEGNFTEVDRIHKGEGKAILLESAQGKVIRFENFKVTNGPDLYVWLTKNPQPTSSIESLGDYVDLGRLKGNVGDQNYSITQDIEGYDTVVIWCKQFSQLFSYANLNAKGD